MLIFLTLAVPLPPLTAKDKSIQIAVPTVNPVIVAEQEKGNLLVVPAPKEFIAEPLVVPVNAAPLIGAVPVPVLI